MRKHAPHVLAIDPGYERVGVAIIARNPESLVHSACITTVSSAPFPERLAHIAQEVERLIMQYRPDVFAIENLFLSKNQKTAMRVAEARGVLLYLAQTNGLSIHEYTPLQVKVAITGDGKSTKSRLMHILPKLIPISRPIQHDDEWDAIAIGLTHCAYVPR